MDAEGGFKDSYSCRQPPKALFESSSKGVGGNACSNIMSDLRSRTIGRLVCRLYK